MICLLDDEYVNAMLWKMNMLGLCHVYDVMLASLSRNDDVCYLDIDMMKWMIACFDICVCVDMCMC